MVCGFLRPLHRQARALVCTSRSSYAGVEPPRDASPDPPAAPPAGLNSIELALIAEYNLEMARANEAVADDATKRLETRRRASDAATAWRHRAQLFQVEAMRQSAQPILPGEPARAYAGPERRRQMRRSQTRRADPASGRAGRGRGDRRAGPERRTRDRRRPELAPR